LRAEVNFLWSRIVSHVWAWKPLDWVAALTGITIVGGVGYFSVTHSNFFDVKTGPIINNVVDSLNSSGGKGLFETDVTSVLPEILPSGSLKAALEMDTPMNCGPESRIETRSEFECTIFLGRSPRKYSERILLVLRIVAQDGAETEKLFVRVQVRGQ
jgi:hypothetical protein